MSCYHPRQQKQENPEDILLNRHYRLQGKPGLAGPGDGNIPREALSPAEANLLKSLTTYGEGLAGVAGLDLLMRVMVNAPDVSMWAKEAGPGRRGEWCVRL